MTGAGGSARPAAAKTGFSSVQPALRRAAIRTSEIRGRALGHPGVRLSDADIDKAKPVTIAAQGDSADAWDITIPSREGLRRRPTCCSITRCLLERGNAEINFEVPSLFRLARYRRRGSAHGVAARPRLRSWRGAPDLHAVAPAGRGRPCICRRTLAGPHGVAVRGSSSQLGRGRVARPFGFALTDPGMRLSRTGSSRKSTARCPPGRPGMSDARKRQGEMLVTSSNHAQPMRRFFWLRRFRQVNQIRRMFCRNALGLRPGYLDALSRRSREGARHERHLEEPGQPAVRGDRR